MLQLLISTPGIQRNRPCGFQVSDYPTRPIGVDFWTRR